MKHRIVIKVGSNVLTRPEGKLDVTRMSAIVDQIAWLRRQDYDVILVSSGAVSAGRDELRTGPYPRRSGAHHEGELPAWRTVPEPAGLYACDAREWCSAYRQ